MVAPRRPLTEAQKEHARRAAREWYAANRERNRETNRAWREANPERLQASQLAYREANREAAREATRAWREANPERAKECDRAYRETNRERARGNTRAWREANPEYAREYARASYKANPERAREDSRARKYVRRGAGPIDAETKAWTLILLADPCVYCGGRTNTLDHIIPINKGGINEYANFAPACRSCNSKKRAHSLLGHLLRECARAEW